MSPVEKNHAAGWNAAVAAQIRAERAAAGLTLDALADKSGVPKRTLIRLVNAERAIDVAHLAAIAEAFGIGINELIARSRSRIPAQSSDGRDYPGLMDEAARED